MLLELYQTWTWTVKVLLKVRLWWFGAVLQYSGKYVLVLLSIDAIRRTIYH